MALSVDANGRMIAGGTGYLVEVRVRFYNETNEMVGISQSGTDYVVVDSKGSVVTKRSEADRPDMMPVYPHSETRFAASFQTDANLHEETHILRVKSGDYVASCII